MMMSRMFFLVSVVGVVLLALVVLAAILALAGVDRFEPAYANPPV
jgi:hypothetical protein